MESAHILNSLSRLVLGTMLLTESDDGVLDEYVRLGGNAIDTARVYGDGDSERALGVWLSRQSSAARERLVIVSKGAHPSGARKRVTPEEIERDLRESVELLHGPIDVYLLHRDDPSVPVGTIIEALNALREAGLIRAFGTSNWTTARIDEANAWAAEHGLEGFCLSSQHLSLADQNEEQWATRGRPTSRRCSPGTSGRRRRCSRGPPRRAATSSDATAQMCCASTTTR